MGNDYDRAEQDYWENQEFYNQQLREYEADRPIAYDEWATLHKSALRDKGKDMQGRTRLEVIKARMAQLEEEAARLESLPEEPTPHDPDWPNIIYFTKSFGGRHLRRAAGSTGYQYAFIKSPGDGLWYGTGPRAPKGYTWDQLMQWLDKSGPMPVIYRVTDSSPMMEEEDAASECSCSIEVRNPEINNLLEDIAGQEDTPATTREARMCSNYRQHDEHNWPEVSADPPFFCKGRTGD